jgi:hypothetical protein
MPRKKSPVTRTGIHPGTFWLVAQRLKHYATPGPSRIGRFSITQQYNQFQPFAIMFNDFHKYIWALSFHILSGIQTISLPRRFNNKILEERLLFHILSACRLQLKRDGTRWLTGGEVKGKLANGVGSQYSSHYLGTWCIQLYYRWCSHFGCQ